VALIGLTLLRNREEEVLAVRERGNFLTTLLESGLDDTEAANGAAAMGFSHARELLLPLAVVRRSPPAGRAGAEDAAWALIWRDVRRELEAIHTPAIAGIRPYERDMLVVVGMNGPERRSDLADRIATALANAGKRHFGTADATVLSVGAPARTWSALRPALREAVDAAVAARHAGPRAWHDATRPDLDRFLWRMRESAELQAFVDRRLGAIVEHDANRKSKLLPTLEAYCAHGGRKAETARALHLERQSLYHRIERIEALLGDRLAEQDTYLSVHLALRARAHLGGSSA
jgi:purine catabolism regulator